jgi:ABC-type transport system substrate-binding protein
MRKILHTLSHFFSSLRTVVGNAYQYGKGSTRALFSILLFLAVCGALFFFQTLLAQQSNIVPRSGGVLTEGLVGSPVSVDPLSAVSETEQALSRVFFSDLATLASTIEWNDAQTEATVTLKEGIRFHDKKPLTADDVLFTYEKTRSSTNQSEAFYTTASRTTLTAQGPLSLIISSSTEIPSSFLELGIIPKHIWEKEVISEKESMIGTGPFKATRIIYKKDGIGQITTTRFSHGPHPLPYIRKIRFIFFENTERLMNAINEDSIESAIVDANEFAIHTENFSILPTNESIVLYALPSYDGVFSGTRATILEEMIDKNQILATVRNSYGSISGSHTPSSESFSEESQTLLKQKGVVFTKEGTVSQSPSTTLYLRDDPELIHTAQLLQNYYGILGLPIELKIFSRGVFREEIEKNPAALVLGYTTDTVVSSQRPLFPLFSLGVGNYAHYSASVVDSPFDIRRRYEHIHTWSLRKELQWKTNKTEK